LLYMYVSEALLSGNWFGLGSHVEFLLRIFQTLALIEVLHAALGLVRSSPFTTAVQISSRVFVVWGILFLLPEEQSIGVPLILISWSFAEIIRYVFYMLNICNISSSLITWLRYSAFMFLYPTGITVSSLKETDRYSFALPNKLNCSFDYQFTILMIMASYVPGKRSNFLKSRFSAAPRLYLYMLSQRRRVFKTKLH
uniref:Very-long-chain (3R)-3-hydroxyacyl-CoA dehydratase n=1 Tax=Echinostoma caproni TaxID=27848 RepID=A0A183B5V3_9TREM